MIPFNLIPAEHVLDTQDLTPQIKRPILLLLFFEIPCSFVTNILPQLIEILEKTAHCAVTLCPTQLSSDEQQTFQVECRTTPNVSGGGHECFLNPTPIQASTSSFFKRLREILQLLNERRHLESFVPIAAIGILINTDIYPDSTWTFTLGQADERSPVAVISLTRLLSYLQLLKPCLMDRENQLLRSCTKLILHELGHIFGLKHCPLLPSECRMSPSQKTSDLFTSTTTESFCNECSQKMESGRILLYQRFLHSFPFE